MPAFTLHESHRRQGHNLSAAFALQGGHSCHSVFVAGGVDGRHSDGETEFIPRRESAHHSVVPSSRWFTDDQIERIHQGPSSPCLAYRIGRPCSRSRLPELSSASEARRGSHRATCCATSRRDIAAAFSEEGMVGQMTKRSCHPSALHSPTFFEKAA